ncbi:MAG: hypothetical protein H0W84_01585 [Bacteroidetes bacterium]|nr:hypothetical protein [Bacteroidota bacterium]
MMKKLIISAAIFILIFSTKVFSQQNNVESMRFAHDFNITGITLEKQTVWVDSIMKSLPQVISCVTDFKTRHTKIVVHEAFNSPQLLQKIIIKLGFDIDMASYVNKLEQ